MPPAVWVGITVDCAEPARLAAFWSELLGRDSSTDPDLPGWVRLGAHSDALPVINFQPVAEPKVGKVRLHLDVSVDDIEVGMADVLRLGGTFTGERHEYPGAGVVVVMVDPEGNEFCLVQYF